LVVKTFNLNEQQWADLRQQLVKQVRVSDGQFEYEFRCETPVEVWRAKTLPVKEAGTIQWIAGRVQSGDVFYDIGANIGLYTLVAGKRVGPAGMVYAFEPHVKNVDSYCTTSAATVWRVASKSCLAP